MTASVGYINSEFDEFQDYLGDYSGNKVSEVPDYTFSIGGQYRAGNGFLCRSLFDWCWKHVLRQGK